MATTTVLLTMAVAIGCCCGVGWILGRGLGWTVRGGDTRLAHVLSERLRSVRSRPEPEDETMQILLCELELRRLAQLVQDTYDNDQPHKYQRLQASRAAYDTALLNCCTLVSADIPREIPPLTPARRLEAEMALMAAGVDW